MKHSKYSRFHPAGRLLISVSILLALLITTPATLTLADDDGYALDFDGETDLVELNETVLIMGENFINTKTAELWVKPEGTAISCYMEDVAKCDSIVGDKPIWWGIKRGIIGGQDRIWVYNTDDNNDKIGITYTPGVWVHIALVHDGGTLRAYKNGVEAGSVASGPTGQPDTGAHPVLYLGGVIKTSESNHTFEGQIDEVRLWSVARSTTEISNNMRVLLSGSEPGLAAYYQMSDGSGTTLTDDSIHNWNGTLLDGDVDVPPNGAPPLWVTSTAFDVIGPTVTINQAVGQADPTANGPITFSVVFSEDVTGFTAPADVDLSASTVGGTLSISIGGGGANYTLTITGMTGSGQVIASIPANVAQNVSALGNNASTSTDNSVSFDGIRPTVTINQAVGQPDPATTLPINFTVTFSENVTGFTSGDVTLSGIAGTPTVNVTGGPATYTVAVGGLAYGETVTASIAAGVAIDAAGNTNVPGTWTDNQVTYRLYSTYLPLVIR